MILDSSKLESSGGRVDHGDEKDTVMDTSDLPQQESLNLRDMAFSFRMTPYVMVENLLNAERLTALITDSEDEEIDEGLDDSDSDSGNEFII